MKKLKNLCKFLIVIALIFTVLCPVCVMAEEDPTQEKKQVSISFDSMGGEKCETIYGYAGETVITRDMLPTPKKEGYTFKEWRHFNEYGMPFELEVFPNFNITLVAAYEPNGFTVTFEEGISEIYDLGSGIELYAPDTNGYVHETVKEGWRCLKTKKSVANPKFLISYTNTLEVGKEYELSIWLKTKKDSASGPVDFLYTENPDVRAKVIGYQKAFDLKEMEQDKWCEYRLKFVAAAPYIIVRLPNVSDLYVDEITVERTGSVGDIPTLKHEAGSKVITVVALCAVAACVAVIIFVIKRKSKPND